MGGHTCDDVCCGRALISKGLLEEARSTHIRLVERLGPPALAGVPIVGCEPSCILTLRDELPDLLPEKSEDAEAVARQARLADDLIAEALEDGSIIPDPESPIAGHPILFHGPLPSESGRRCSRERQGAAGDP